MRPSTPRSLMFAVLMLSTAAQAEGVRCHIRMDDGQRFELLLKKNGASVESPLGKITLTNEYGGTLQMDQDVYDMNSGGSRSGKTGSVRLKTMGMDESDEAMENQNITSDFEVNIASEMYLRKDQDQGVLTCATLEGRQPVGGEGIQQVQEMPAFYDQGEVLQARMDSYIDSPQLAKASVDTKKLIEVREAKFMNSILGDVTKIKLTGDDSEGLGEFFERRLKETKIVDEESYVKVDSQNYSSGKPTLTVSVTAGKLEILRTSNGIEYSTVNGSGSNLDDLLAKNNFLFPGYSVLKQDSSTQKKLTVLSGKNGQMKFISTESSQGSARALFYSAAQYAALDSESTSIELFSETDSTAKTLNAMGRPALGEVKLGATNKSEHKVKTNEGDIFSVLMESLGESAKKNNPAPEKMEKALADSGLEKSIDSTPVGMARVLLSEGLRLMFGLERSNDPHIMKAVEQRLNHVFETSAKDKDGKVLAKLIFIDRMKVIREIEHELKIDLHISKQDSLEAFQQKSAMAMKSIKNPKQAAQVAVRLQKWVLRQPVSMQGLFSWTGLDQQTPENRKKVLQLITELTAASFSLKEIKPEQIRPISEQIARMLISLNS